MQEELPGRMGTGIGEISTNAVARNIQSFIYDGGQWGKWGVMYWDHTPYTHKHCFHTLYRWLTNWNLEVLEAERSVVQ